MNERELIARLEAIEARLDVLEGGNKEQGPKRAPASPVRFVKREEHNYPRWVYRLVNGEVQSALINKPEDMPDGEVFDSPADAKESAEKPTDAPQTNGQDKSQGIPEDWRSLHHFKRISLAKTLPGGEDVVSADDADAVIELELERRGNSN